MREILFRGKSIISGGWVYGNLFVSENNEHEICIGTPTIRITRCIDISTIGQYTGLTDKNGTKIYEGDIIRDVSTGYVYEIKYERLGFLRADKKRFYYWTFSESDYEVIGNIYDNPELLKEGAKK